MHKLVRQVRFSINPFLAKDRGGFNPFASEPAGEGLSIFFELSVALAGEVEPATGFVVNVVDIDRCVREYVVPIFSGRVREDFRQGRHIGLSGIAELLKSSWERLADEFGTARLSELSLKLNPFRKVTIDPVRSCGSAGVSGTDAKRLTSNEIDCEGTPKDCKMIYFSEKFEFAATHKLWNDDFSQERNFEVFGKCANPAGHGHNYVVEVTVKTPVGVDSFCIGDFERIVDNELIKLLDHKNLNGDVAQFSRTNPTVENIAAFAWNKLVGKFSEATLHCISVWETDKTYCSYYG